MSRYRNPVYDFIRRTKASLLTIEDGAKTDSDKYYEVTQLINSVIGLLMFPKEAVYNSIPTTPLSRFTGAKFPKILHGDLPEDNLRELIRYLRNGFAHYNVNFENYDNQIKGLYIWNVTPDGTVDWVAYISIVDLRGLLELAAREFMKITEKRIERDGLSRIEKSIGKNLRMISPEGRE